MKTLKTVASDNIPWDLSLGAYIKDILMLLLILTTRGMDLLNCLSISEMYTSLISVVEIKNNSTRSQNLPSNNLLEINYGNISQQNPSR